MRRESSLTTNLINFITEDKWIILKNLVKTNTPARQHILAEIAASVNIINPDQPTLYRMVSILAHCEKNYAMSQKEVFNFMDRIKYIIKAKKKDKALPYVEAYPHAADNLPDQIKNHAYPEGLPVVVDIPELTNILGDSKMRGRQDIPADMAWLNEVPPHLKATVLDSVRKQGLAEATHMSQHHSESAPKSETLSSIDLRGKSRRFAVPQAPRFGNLAPRALPSSHVKDEQTETYESFGLEDVKNIAEYRAKLKEEVKKELEDEMKGKLFKAEPEDADDDKDDTDDEENTHEKHGSIDELENAMKNRVSPKEKRHDWLQQKRQPMQRTVRRKQLTRKI